MTRLAALLGSGLLLGSLLPRSGLVAQSTEAAPPMELRLDREGGSLEVVLGDFLESEGLSSSLQSGLPLRIHLVAELWKDRFFDSQEGRIEWRATILYEPLGRRYEVRTSAVDGGGDPGVRSVTTLGAARLELQRSLVVPLRPMSEGTFYYTATMEVETLSLSDLEELQRWLKGELAPAVSGDGDVEGAMGRGVKRLMVRMLGLPTRRFRDRTPTFRFDPGGS